MKRKKEREKATEECTKMNKETEGRLMQNVEKKKQEVKKVQQ